MKWPQKQRIIRGAAAFLENPPSLTAHSGTMAGNAPLTAWFKDSF